MTFDGWSSRVHWVSVYCVFWVSGARAMKRLPSLDAPWIDNGAIRSPLAKGTELNEF